MEHRSFYPKKAPLWQYSLIVIGGALIGGLLVGSIIRYLILPTLQQMPFDINSRRPLVSFGLVFSITFSGFVVLNSVITFWCARTKAHLEIDGEQISEFDRKGRLIATGKPSEILSIDFLWIFRHSIHILRFSNGSFVCLGSGYLDSKPLLEFVLANTTVEPTRLKKFSMQKLGEEMGRRKPIDPGQRPDSLGSVL